MMACNGAGVAILRSIAILAVLAGNAYAAHYTPPPVAPLQCDGGFFVIDGSCMRVFKTGPQHKLVHIAFCPKHGAQLASIDSEPKNAWVQRDLEFQQAKRATFRMEIRRHVVLRAPGRYGFHLRTWSNFENEMRYKYHRHFAIRAGDGKWVMVFRANPADAVVCEKLMTYPPNWCAVRPLTTSEPQYTPRFIQGVCLRVRNTFRVHLWAVKRENERNFWKGKTQCEEDGCVMARIDTPEKNSVAWRLLADKTYHAANGYFDYPWQSTTRAFPHIQPTQTYTYWDFYEPKYPATRKCVIINKWDGKWNTQDCNKESLPVCQVKRRPRCFTPTHILHATIRVKDAYQRIQVTCHPGMKRIGPTGDVYCTNTRYGDYFPDVRCVPGHAGTYPRYTNKTACKNRYLAFPPGVIPQSAIPTFAYANATCRKANMDVPTDYDIGCVQSFLQSIRKQSLYPFFATGDTGPWIYLPGHVKKYRWFDIAGNTRGFKTPTELNYKNTVVCVGTISPHGSSKAAPAADAPTEDPALQAPFITFRDKNACPDKIVYTSKKRNITTFQEASTVCLAANLTVPDYTSLTCMQAFVTHIQNDSRFAADFVTATNGPWIHLDLHGGTPYQWLDENGKTRGYESNTTSHNDNRAVCIRIISPGPSGDGEAVATIGALYSVTGTIIGLFALAVTATGYFYFKPTKLVKQNNGSAVQTARRVQYERKASNISQTQLMASSKSSLEIDSLQLSENSRRLEREINLVC